MGDHQFWPLVPGDQLKRQEIHKLEVRGVHVGGRHQHGITSCLEGAAHLVFMGEGGEENGYGKHDYFVDDDTISYTGEGPVGNQSLLSSGNKFLANASSTDVVHFFWRAKKSDPYTYVGEVAVGPPTWRWDRAPDRNGDERDVLVFTLKRAGNQSQSLSELKLLTPVAAGDRKPAVIRNSDALWTPPATSDVIVPGSSGGVATRSEHTLQKDFGEWLLAKGNDVRQQSIEGQLPDFVDRTDGFVIEAKGSSERSAVRQAIGQVLDYADSARRAQSALKPAILLPARPDDPRAELVLRLGITLIYRDSQDGFVYEYPEGDELNYLLLASETSDSVDGD